MIVTARPSQRSPAGLVLVTGAGGFLGTEVARALARAGWRVRGTVRSLGASLPLDAEASFLPDLLDARACAAVLQGVTHVVHLAGRAHVRVGETKTSMDEFRRVNVQGTDTLIRAALDAGVRQFVFVSSAAAASGGVQWLSHASQGTPEGAYGESKRQAENIVLERTESAGAGATILRPPMVYGPGMKGNPLRLFRLIDRGIPLPLGSVRNRRSVLYSGNLSAAINAVLGAPTDGTRTIHVADAEPVSTPELVRMIAGALGRPVRLWLTPVRLLEFAGRIGDIARRLGPWPLDSTTARRLTGSFVLDTAELTEAIGFRPPYSTMEGIEETARWFRLQRPRDVRTQAHRGGAQARVGA